MAYSSLGTPILPTFAAVGPGLYHDGPSWFWKIYYDPPVNCTRPIMARFGVGLKL